MVIPPAAKGITLREGDKMKGEVNGKQFIEKRGKTIDIPQWPQIELGINKPAV
jgi:hypothetical protein